jgi:hypothetical protein
VRQFAASLVVVDTAESAELPKGASKLTGRQSAMGTLHNTTAVRLTQKPVGRQAFFPIVLPHSEMLPKEMRVFFAEN